MEFNFLDYIRPEFLILLPVCWLLGWVIKKSKIRDEWIPVILFSFAIGMALIYILATSTPHGREEWFMAVFLAITQGFLVAGAAVGGNQLIKQTNRIDFQKQPEQMKFIE